MNSSITIIRISNFHTTYDSLPQRNPALISIIMIFTLPFVSLSTRILYKYLQ